MILGNPYKFAVLIDPIESWNTDDTFCNGLLFLCVPPQQAFVEIYNFTFPKNVDVDNDYRFDISPTSLADNNYFLFAVCDSTNTSARILASTLDYELENSRHKLQGISVNEAIISVAELREIISGLDNLTFS